MALPTIPGALRVTVRGSIANGGNWTNTWHLTHIDATSWDASEIQGAHDIFKQLYIGPGLSGGTMVLQHCASSVTTTDVQYLPLDQTSLATTIAMAFAGNIAGTETLPPSVSAVLTLRTNERGRSRRGRVFLPPFAETLNVAGLISSTAITGLIAQFNAVQTALRAGGGELVVASYKLGNARAIANVTMDPRWDSQRGRKR